MRQAFVFALFSLLFMPLNACVVSSPFPYLNPRHRSQLTAAASTCASTRVASFLVFSKNMLSSKQKFDFTQNEDEDEVEERAPASVAAAAAAADDGPVDDTPIAGEKRAAEAQNGGEGKNGNEEKRART